MVDMDGSFLFIRRLVQECHSLVVLASTLTARLLLSNIIHRNGINGIVMHVWAAQSLCISIDACTECER